MTRISATEASRNFSDILNRAQHRGESFEVIRGGKIVARIEPARPKRVTLGELLDHWKTWPRLDPEDAARWEEDLKEIRVSAPSPPSKWD